MWHKGFWIDDRGQDVVEYTLLLATVCLFSAALFLFGGSSVSGIWGKTNSNLTAASTLAAS